VPVGSLVTCSYSMNSAGAASSVARRTESIMCCQRSRLQLSGVSPWPPAVRNWFQEMATSTGSRTATTKTGLVQNVIQNGRK
jgi:hypothetical protein